MDANQKIQTFYNACTDMKNAKFILAETKISAILRSIVNSPELVSIVSDSLAGFNFSNEFNKIQVKNDMRRINIILPNNPQKLVAIVFSLLGEIDSHRLDFHDFVYSYFDAGGSSLLECYNKFVSGVVLPFRDTLCELADFTPQVVEQDEPEQETNTECESDELDTCFDDTTKDTDFENEENDMFENDDDFDYVEEDDNTTQPTGVDARIEDFFNDIRVILNQIKDTVNNDPRIKQDRLNELNITIDASLQAIDYHNLKILNALMISLNNLLHFVKSTKFYNNELQNRIAEFYDEML